MGRGHWASNEVWYLEIQVSKVTMPHVLDHHNMDFLVSMSYSIAHPHFPLWYAFLLAIYASTCFFGTVYMPFWYFDVGVDKFRFDYFNSFQ